jgi:hypothetical protein
MPGSVGGHLRQMGSIAGDNLITGTTLYFPKGSYTVILISSGNAPPRGNGVTSTAAPGSAQTSRPRHRLDLFFHV